MLTIDETVADRPDLQGASFDGSLELLREPPSRSMTKSRRRLPPNFTWLASSISAR